MLTQDSQPIFHHEFKADNTLALWLLLPTGGLVYGVVHALGEGRFGVAIVVGLMGVFCFFLALGALITTTIAVDPQRKVLIWHRILGVTYSRLLIP